jgi:hypothetical protein
LVGRSVIGHRSGLIDPPDAAFCGKATLWDMKIQYFTFVNLRSGLAKAQLDGQVRAPFLFGPKRCCDVKGRSITEVNWRNRHFLPPRLTRRDEVTAILSDGTFKFLSRQAAPPAHALDCLIITTY